MKTLKVLSPKKWMSLNSFKYYKQKVLSHPLGKTSKLIYPPIE